MKVIIAEKPDVARSIARVLNVTNKNDGYISNDEYSITWCFGHLVGIADPEAHGYSKKWIKEELPLLPSEFQLAITDDAGIKKQFNIISSLFSKASEIIVATDAGREGELIFRYVYEMSGSSTPFKRLWISSLTDEAIELGLSKLMPGSSKDNLYYSAKLGLSQIGYLD